MRNPQQTFDEESKNALPERDLRDAAIEHQLKGFLQSAEEISRQWSQGEFEAQRGLGNV